MKTALMIDMQDTLINVMHNKNELLRQSEILLNGLKILGINIITSEQYPEKLGKTNENLVKFIKSEPYGKLEFSCVKNENLKAEIEKFDEFIVFGVEAHICVLQTVKDLTKMGKKVTLIEPCISSRDPRNKELAVNLMRDMGVEITSVESVLFEILESAKHQNFKEISKLIR